MTLPKMQIQRITSLNGKDASNPTGQANRNGAANSQPTNRRLFQSSGGSGLIVATHLAAIDRIEGQTSVHCHYDSDHGDHRQTTLPDGTIITLPASALCGFGVDDPRVMLRSIAKQVPTFAREYYHRLRGVTVSQTNRRGAAQVRPMGLLQLDLGIGQVTACLNRALDQLFPQTTMRGTNLAHVHDSHAARQQAELPMLDVHIASGVGGQGSATFLTLAYLSRWLMDKRKAKNVTRIGVLLGPRAFKGRGSLSNYAATLRELDRAYRDGFRHVLRTGEVIEYPNPPFDLLFLLDRPEPGKDLTTEGAEDKLSDVAMDDWLRQVALSIHLLTSHVMHDRLQSVLLNVQNTDCGGAWIGTFNGALVNGDLQVMEEAIALQQAQTALQALLERCSGGGQEQP
jgi:hypothetical protein